MGLYDVGDERVVEGRFYDEDGALADPGAVTLTIVAPDGTVTTPVPNHPSTGVYTHVLSLTQVGVWSYTYSGTGAIAQVETGYLLVGPGPSHYPCSTWASPAELFATGAAAGIEAADRNYVEAEAACRAATEYLFERSGRVFTDVCPRTVRPCARSGSGGYGFDVPVSLSTYWYGSCGCGCSAPARCACGGYDELVLPGDLVLFIAEVLVGGVALDPGAYRLAGGSLLRIDGGSWPTCQDLTEDPSTAGSNTFQVTYYSGRAVPELGRLAARELAAELYLSLIGSSECRLPSQVQSLSRQGITMAFVSPPDFAAGNTGLGAVDAFLGAYGRRRRATVASPDVPLTAYPA